MSAATAGADAGAPPAKGKKKLIIIVAAVLVLALGSVGALLALKKPAVDEDEEAPVAKAAAKAHDPKNPPVFAPLEPFTVNLADREAERYAQVGITLELDDPHTADTLKAYLPAVRNNILLLLAAKTSTELLAADGKTQLARDVQRETARALGVVFEEEAAAEADDDETASRKKKKKKKAEPALPVTAVYFSTFIIQ